MLMLPTAATMSATTSSSGFKGANGGGGGGGGGGSRRPSLPPMPDLSHLTEDERKLIESVIQRQRDEEEREHDMLRKLQDDYRTYKASVDKLQEELAQTISAGGPGALTAAAAAGTGPGGESAVCQICRKTQFADGRGNQCSQCGLRSCARCGGKVTFKSDKPSWFCNVCKKKHELMTKTGQWYHGGMARPVAIDFDTVSDGATYPYSSSTSFTLTSGYGGGSGDRGATRGDDQSIGSSTAGGPSQRTSTSRSGAEPEMPDDDMSCRGGGRTRSVDQQQQHQGVKVAPNGDAGDQQQQQQQQQAGGRSAELRRQFSQSGKHRASGRPGGRPSAPNADPSPSYTTAAHGGDTSGHSHNQRSGEGKMLLRADSGGGGEERSRADSGSTRQSMHSSGYVSSDNQSSIRAPPAASSGGSVTRGSRHAASDTCQSADEGLASDERHHVRPSSSATTSANGGGGRRTSGRRGPPSDEMPLDEPVDECHRYGEWDRERDDHSQRRSQHPHQQQKVTPLDSSSAERKGGVAESDNGLEGRGRGSGRSRKTSSSSAGPQLRHSNSADEPPMYATDRRDAPASVSGRRGSDMSPCERRPERLMRGAVDRNNAGGAPLSSYAGDSEQHHGSNRSRNRPASPSGSGGGRREQCIAEEELTGGGGSGEMNRHSHYHHRQQNLHQQPHHYPHQQQHLNPTTPAKQQATTASRGGSTVRTRRRLESMLPRNDSLSSDPSDCTRPPPPRPHKHKVKKRLRQLSLSSSEDDENVSTTSECTSCGEEQEVESESISERGLVMGDTRGRGDDKWRRDEILEAKIKKFLAHPVAWKRSGDGTKLIGHMILHKSHIGGRGDGGGVLGLKVTGGKRTEDGHLSAFVTKVKRGSIADVEGHLKTGDEVIEWNGRPLRNLTFDEVYDIIFESKQELQVELIVQRSIGPSYHNERLQAQPSIESAVSVLPGVLQTAASSGARPSITLTSDTDSVILIKTDAVPASSSATVCGIIQLKFLYEAISFQLYVTVINAVGLPPRDNNQLRNPYCKLHLLPDRGDVSKYRTKTVAGSCEPEWNQTFVYQNMSPADMQTKSLEVSLFDYDRIGSGEYIGEVVVVLANVPVQDEVVTFTLRQMDECSPAYSFANDLTDNNAFLPGVVPSENMRVYGDAPSQRLPSVSGMSDISMERISRQRVPSDTTPPRSRSVDRTPPVIDSLASRRRFPTAVNQQQQPIRVRPNTTTPPCHRQLPFVSQDMQKHSRQKVTQQLEQRARQLKMRMDSRRQSPALSTPISETQSLIGGFMHASDTQSTLGGGGGMHVSDTEAMYMTRGQQWKRDLDFVSPLARDHTVSRVASRESTTAVIDQSTVADTLQQPGAPRKMLPRPTPASGLTKSLQQEKAKPGSGVGAAAVTSALVPATSIPMGRMTALQASSSAEEAVHSDASEASETSDISKTSAAKSQAQQTRTLSEFTNRMDKRVAAARSKRQQMTRSLSHNDAHEDNEDDIELLQELEEPTFDDKTDGNASDSGLSVTNTEPAPMSLKRRSSLVYKVAAIMGLTKKSRSASQLNATGKKGGKVSFKRSEEVGVPATMQQSQPVKDTLDSVSICGSVTNESMHVGRDGNFGNFVEGLGPAQLVGRQVLGAQCLGEIQLALADRKGHLEVEVIRARGLVPKPGTKVVPAPYVKVYLIDGKTSVEKQKTGIARRTLDPLYQQQLIFDVPYQNKILQVTCWGDYGRMERKVFMGVAQVMLDDLDLTSLIIGWYKLYPSSSLVSSHQQGQGQGLTRNLSLTSLDSTSTVATKS